MKVNKMQLFLAGAIAVSSVSAATPAAAATSDTERFDDLTAQQRAMLEVARKHMNKDMGLLIKSSYPNGTQLIADLKGLTSEMPTDSGMAETKFAAFEAASAGYLNAQERADFRKFVADIALTVIDADADNLDAIIPLMEEKYATVPPSIKAAINWTQAMKTALAIRDQLIAEKPDTETPGTPGTPGTGTPGTGTPGTGAPAPIPTPETPEAPPNTVVTTPEDLASNQSAVIDQINKEQDLKEFRIDAQVEGTTAVPFNVVQAVTAKNSAATIHIGTEESAYVLPVSVIDGGTLAKKLGTTLSNLSITLTMTKQESSKTLLPFAIDFELKATAPGKKTIDITYLGYPVLRTIETPVAYNAATTVGVRLNEDGTMTPVPTYIDGTNAGLYFSSNSAYTLIANSKTFKDIDNRGYWAEETIEKLASRMVFSGKTADSFSPTAAITRGEFAAVLARGLGLVAEDKNGAGFTDVSSSQAINRNGEIAAVVEAGIVNGYGNGQFRPANAITRDEAAIMISNAMDYIGKEIKMDGTKRVANFNDYRYISASARPHVERVLQAGYISGFKDNTYRSENNTTRAETSVILYNFLKSIKFIN